MRHPGHPLSRDQSSTNLVTLNILKRRKDRSTDTPKDSSGLKYVQMTSNIEPMITCQAERTIVEMQSADLSSVRRTYDKIEYVEWRSKVLIHTKAIHFEEHFEDE